ncbi:MULTISPECIES: HAD family hydrolase [unclassified Mesorhizobium]|uniref:HAD family hydrolase n=1 Tax=unclassified Mesorhizobium TaxID=325217 RepID=UPI003334CEBA
MQPILERLATKMEQTSIGQSKRLSMEQMFDPDCYGEIAPRLPRDEVCQSIGHPDGMFSHGGGITEKTTQPQRPEDRLLWSDLRDTHHKAEIKVHDIPTILDEFGDSIKVLSLDCFDTLLWRKTATPEDVFAVLADHPIARSLGVTVDQRISAAARAYRAKLLEKGSGEIDIHDIYRNFASLSGEERELLAEAEIQTEMHLCFAFSPYVELIRLAHTRGIKIIIVSDMYLREGQLRRLLVRHLPPDVMNAISKIYCSVDYGTPKSGALFPIVIRECGVFASQILHIGDNEVSDAQVPRKLGVGALHFVAFDRKVADFLRLQHAASSLIVLEEAAPKAVVLPCYSPFRPVFSAEDLHSHAPETVIGYMSFGPVLYAYARFLVDEVEALKQRGKRVKVLFLLRDAYLLSAACEAYGRRPIGKLARIGRFVAVAASFKSSTDVDYYLSGINPGPERFRSTAKQLLLPPELTELLIRIAHQSADPQTTFHQLLRDGDVLELIFEKSSALRSRLRRYMSNELELEEGDTIVLADTGYGGTILDFLARTFKDEMKVDILGHYLVASDAPYRSANIKALITTSTWKYDLFEQCCTLKEGAVLNYDVNGKPVLENIELGEKQYEKVEKVQSECVRFINDAVTFFTKSGVTHDFSILQRSAHAALFRHVYMPIEAELEYFRYFEHDSGVGLDRKETIYDQESALKAVRRQGSPYRLGTYETRSLGLDFTFSALVQERFKLNLSKEDMNVRSSPLKISIGGAHESKEYVLGAHHLHDGYFSVLLPYTSGSWLKVVLGTHYEWLQIAEMEILDDAGCVSKRLLGYTDLREITQQGEIYHCLSQESVAIIHPIDCRQFQAPHHYHMIFRPLVWRASDPPRRRGASQ